MTEEDFLKIRKKYDKNGDYKNPFIKTKVKYFFLEKDERGALFEELYNMIYLDYQRILADCKTCSYDMQILNLEGKEPSARLLLKARKLSEDFKILEYLLKLLDNETNFELVTWLYNEGKFREKWEIEVREANFKYYSKKFQKKASCHLRTLLLSIFGGMAFFLWFPIFLAILGVTDALGYMFLLAPLIPITTGIGYFIAIISEFFIFSEEERKIKRIIDGNENWKLAASGVFSVKHSASQIGKAMKTPWINK